MPIAISEEYYSTGTSKEDIKNSLPAPQVVGCFQVVSKIPWQVTGFRINYWDPEDKSGKPLFILIMARCLATSNACTHARLYSRVMACLGKGTAHLICFYHQT